MLFSRVRTISKRIFRGCIAFFYPYPSAPICNLVQLLLYRIAIYSLTLNWRRVFCVCDRVDRAYWLQHVLSAMNKLVQ